MPLTTLLLSYAWESTVRKLHSLGDRGISRRGLARQLLPAHLPSSFTNERTLERMFGNRINNSFLWGFFFPFPFILSSLFISQHKSSSDFSDTSHHCHSTSRKWDELKSVGSEGGWAKCKEHENKFQAGSANSMGNKTYLCTGWLTSISFKKKDKFSISNSNTV